MTRQSTTSRRGFLGFLGAAVAGAMLDPERLLWVPGAKVYSLPSMPLPGAIIRFLNIERLTSPIATGALRKLNGRELYEVAGQSLFPECNYSGKQNGWHRAYLLPTNWREIRGLTYTDAFKRAFPREVIVT